MRSVLLLSLFEGWRCLKVALFEGWRCLKVGAEGWRCLEVGAVSSPLFFILVHDG
jgi:hypothetical protein